MKGKEIYNGKLTGQKIISAFRKIVDLPEYGYIAGGAVSNLLITYSHDVDTPINDVDVFVPSQFPKDKTIDQNDYRHSNWEVNSLYPDILEQQGYYIVEQNKVGLLNKVVISSSQYDYPPRLARILRGFDLNCCGAGIDLATGEMMTTPEFDDFLISHQLKVQNVHSPYRTSLRLLKKRRELKCYTDVDEQLKYLSQVPFLLNYPLWNRIAQHEWSIYLENKDIIDTHFVVSPPIDGFFMMEPRREYKKIQERLRRTNYVGEISTDWQLTEGRHSKVKKNMAVLGTRDRFLNNFLFLNPKYADCDFSTKHLDIINKFLHSHFGMLSLFNRLNLNIAEQIAVIRIINRAAKKYGRYVIGLIESERDNIRAINPETIELLVTDYIAEGNLKQQEDIGGFQLKGYCQEIVTTIDLLKHGEEMEHCVGGYGRAVKEGDSIIFRLSLAEELSTIEYKLLQTEKNKEYRLYQHRGKRNVIPGANHRALEYLLRSYLNKNLDEKVLPAVSVILNGIDHDKRVEEDFELEESEIVREHQKEAEFETLSVLYFTDNRIEALDDMKYIRGEYNRQWKRSRYGHRPGDIECQAEEILAMLNN